ncbi:hypothetical protein [Lacticaseibacillus paracasei]|uniref:hypothetical protein n=1 Tax=Lacticaseibacillus paracasei TaxID=1597 RepID=UPI001C019AA5|nr:hypothetical protein [Lacticaseibacillus paracasei]MBT9262797.1 hypothetical protein [Lacticaseibacillus paracasei]UWP75597.1 hypothetical protein KZR06_08940 [Lacticaseibacillus paracasei]
MIESKVLKKAYEVHKAVQSLGTIDDATKSADMLEKIVSTISENVMLRRQLAYTKLKTK